MSDKHYTLQEAVAKTVDGRVVPAGSSEAAFFYKGAGKTIPLSEAEEAGLVTAPKKQAAKPADKKRARAKDK